jgi:hypothetical protein
MVHLLVIFIELHKTMMNLMAHHHLLQLKEKKTKKTKRG